MLFYAPARLLSRNKKCTLTQVYGKKTTTEDSMILAIMAIAAIVGGLVAHNKGRMVFLWTVLCGLIPLALLILFALPRIPQLGVWRPCPFCFHVIPWQASACAACLRQVPLQKQPNAPIAHISSGRDRTHAQNADAQLKNTIMRNNKMKCKKTVVIALCIVLFMCSVLHLHTSPQAYAATPTGALQDAVERGTLRVGMSSFIPWAMQDKKGNYIGFEVDVAKRLAKDFGLELEILPTRWSGIVPALLTGKFDIIICGLSITPERSLRVNFSIPYDHTTIEIIGKKEKLKDTHKIDDYNSPDTIIAVRTGTTAAAAAKKVLPKASIRYFDDEATAVQEMLTGRASMLFTSAPLGSFEVLNNEEELRHVLEDGIFPQPIAMAVRKGDADTLNALDAWIRNLEGEGWLEERRRYWFESKDWEPLLQ